MRGKITKPSVCFCLSLETYHIFLSSITTIIFTTLEYINKKEEPQETQRLVLVRHEVVESKAPCSSSMPSRMALHIIFTSTPLNAMGC